MNGRTLRDALAEWHSFVRGESHVLREFPALMFQQAANYLEGSGPRRAAESRWGTGLERRAWIRRLNRPSLARPLVTRSVAATAGSFSADGASLASVGRDRLWMLDAATLADRVEHREPGWQLLGHSIAAGRLLIGRVPLPGLTTVRIAALPSGRRIATAACPTRPDRIGLAPDGRTIVALLDGAVRLWAVGASVPEQDEELPPPCGSFVDLPAGDQTLHCWDASADGSLIVAGDANGQVWIWEAATGRLVRRLTGAAAPVWVVRVAPDGRRLAWASYDPDTARGEWTLADLDPAAPPRRLAGLSWGPRAAAFSADGVLVAVGLQKSVSLFDAATLTERAVLAGFDFAPTWCAFSPSGRQLAVATGGDQLHLFDLPSALERRGGADHGSHATTCAWSGGGGLVATGAQDGSVCVWSHRTGDLAHRRVDRGPITALAFSPDGSRLASAAAVDRAVLHGAPVRGAEVSIHDLARDEPGLSVEVPGGEVFALAFLGDGSRLAAGSRLALSLRRAETGDEVARCRLDAGFDGWAFDPARSLFVLRTRDGSLLAWNPEDGSLRPWRGRWTREAGLFISCEPPRHYWDLAWSSSRSAAGGRQESFAPRVSPDDSTVALAEDAGTILIADRSAGTERRLAIRGRRVGDLAWSADGAVLAVADDGGMLSLVEAASGEVAARFHLGAPGWLVSAGPEPGLFVAGASSGFVGVLRLERPPDGRGPGGSGRS